MSYQFQKSEQWFERAQKSAPGGVHSPVRGFRGVGGPPRFIERAAGTKIFDVDGNAYTDYCMSWGPLISGHADPEVREAVVGALSRGWSYGAAEPYSCELVEFIANNIPWAEKLRLVNSGTEAVMSTLRVARAATGRSCIVKFDGCYHGHADSMLVRAGSGLAEMASPDSAGVSAAVAAETIVAPLGDLNALERIFSLHGPKIAAVIVEPVPANNGLLLQAEGFLEGVARIARQAGSLIIFDEVITGFRVAFGGMAEISGVRPDLVTYGKIIGGGFPVGAYGGRADLMDLVAPAGPVYQAGTLSANPVSVIAGLTMLKKLKRENPYRDLAERTVHLGRSIERSWAKAGHSVGLHIQSFASLFWPVFTSDPSETGKTVRTPSAIPNCQREVFAQVFHHLLAKGIYLAPSGFEVGFLSTAHTDSDFEAFVSAMSEMPHVSIKSSSRPSGEAAP